MLPDDLGTKNHKRVETVSMLALNLNLLAREMSPCFEGNLAWLRHQLVKPYLSQQPHPNLSQRRKRLSGG
jgi:hypothetical protein